MNAETIAKALGGRKAGGGWMARCPAHDDREAEPVDPRRTTTARCWCAAMRAATRSSVIAALRSRGLWEENGPSPAHAPRAACRCKRPTGSRRRQAHRGRARHLAVCDAGRRHAGRDLSRLARPASSAAADAPLPCRAEASFGRHLAGDGRAGDARRGRHAACDPPHLPRPRRRRQGAGRSAEDDARPVPWRRGAARACRATC